MRPACLPVTPSVAPQPGRLAVPAPGGGIFSLGLSVPEYTVSGSQNYGTWSPEETGDRNRPADASHVGISSQGLEMAVAGVLKQRGPSGPGCSGKKTFTSLEIETATSDMKCKWDRLTRRMDATEKETTEQEQGNRVIQTKGQREKTNYKLLINEVLESNRASEISGTVSNKHLTGVPERERTEWGKGIFEERTIEHFLKMKKYTNP